ncbi:hypothetical protein DFJ73DRAFT_960119 [Zopfochytrium polystomum]|nr:hypothetical protein DFJ73DRAFT_960119 [Zopfochytrium polystomum]
MGVLSKTRVSLVFDADAWVDDMVSPAPSSSLSSSSSSSPSKIASAATPTTPMTSTPAGASSTSRSPHLYPVFEFPESRQRPPALGGGLEVRRAYEEWKAASGGPDAFGVGRVRGRVVLDVEAGSVGRATVRVESVVVRLVRRDPMEVGVREVLYEETLWAAKDRGEEEFAGSTSFPFSLPILPSLSPTFTEVPKATTAAALGTGHARGALYSVIAIVNRPLVREIDTAAIVFLRHAAPRNAIDRTPFAVHRGTIAGGAIAYTIAIPRVVAASATSTFLVVVRLFATSQSVGGAWTATGKTSEWFGASPAWLRHLKGKAEARKDMEVYTRDLTAAKDGPVRECVADGGGRRGRGAGAVVIVIRAGDGTGPEQASGEEEGLGGGEDIADGEADEDVETLFGGLGRGTGGGDADGDAVWAASVLGVGGETAAATAIWSGEATLQLGTAGLRGDWCDGEFYLAHCAEIALAPAAAAGAAPAAGGRRRWLAPPRGKGEQGETVRVPFRVVYAAEGDHAAGWVLPAEWDEWPWRRIEAMEGYKPLWMGRK